MSVRTRHFTSHGVCIEAAPINLTGRDEDESCNSVDVWGVSLRQPVFGVRGLQAVLSTSERRRAVRFRFERHSQDFIVARGALRVILGSYLSTRPEHLHFRYNRWGKPSVGSKFGKPPVRFSVSRSGNLSLVAVSFGNEIGVDLERVREDVECDKVAETCFSPSESKVLRELPASLRRRAFFNCWTRKEAYVKGLGKGVSVPLTKFDVSLAPGEDINLLNVEWDPADTSRWRLGELQLGSEYVGALAVKRRDLT